jgi:hypothetical protein
MTFTPDPHKNHYCKTFSTFCWRCQAIRADEAEQRCHELEAALSDPPENKGA